MTRDKPARESHRMSLRGRDVDFQIKRYRGRSSVGLIIDHRGLTITAPRRASYRMIYAAIEQHGTWVLQKLDSWATPRHTVVWHDGAILPYLGETITLRQDLFHTGAPRLEDEILWLAPGQSAAHMQSSVVQWYRQQALALLPARLAAICARHAIEVPRFALSNAETRWGSCNARGVVRLSWRLIKASSGVIDYVICHELAHLRHMDHSPAFWRAVAKLYPRYQAAEVLLKRNDRWYRSF